jgi:hypothetical protein
MRTRGPAGLFIRARQQRDLALVFKRYQRHGKRTVVSCAAPGTGHVEKRAVKKLRKKFAEEISPQMTGRMLHDRSAEPATGAGNVGLPCESRIFHGGPPLRQRTPRVHPCAGFLLAGGSHEKILKTNFTRKIILQLIDLYMNSINIR